MFRVREGGLLEPVLLSAALEANGLGTGAAVADIDNDGVLDDVDNCPRLQEDYFGEIDGCPSRNLNWVDSDSDSIPAASV